MGVQSLSQNEAASLAAREIVKHLENAELFALPADVWDGERDAYKVIGYDEVVALVEGIIAHHFSLDLPDETRPTATAT